MEQSISDFAKDAIRNLKNSFFQGRGGYYAQMDQESENDDDDDPNTSHSLFYSVHYQNNEDSIPLTHSNAYSDRSQLLFDQKVEDIELEDSNYSERSNYEENYKPSSIYLDQPEASNSQYPTAASLSESLLPTSASTPKGIDKLVDKKYRDPLFAILYSVSLGLFLISGIIISITTNSHAIEGYISGSTFKTIKDSAGILSIIIATALIMGTIWIYILRTFTKAFVWGTAVCIPITLSAVFIWTLIESFQSHYYYEGNSGSNEKDTGLTFMSFIPLILNLIYIKLVYAHRHRINKTVSVIELACDVVKHNPGIFIVSFILLAVFIVFSIIWIIFFNRLWLIGHLGDKSSVSGTVWIVNNYVYSLAAFYVFIYMWTSKLLIYMERFALSAITSQWYFHRNEPFTDTPWKLALIRACSTSFGTLAFGSFILAVIQFLQFVARSIRKYSKSARPFAAVFSFILAYIDALVSMFSNYTISLAGITGESFLSAAKTATKIFRRNLISGVFGDLLTQLILYIGASVIALTSGFGAYLYAIHNLHSPHGFVVGLIATLMPWYISQFFSYTMMSIIDASFLCYAIDLDTGMVHLSAAHTAFSSFD